MVLAEGDARAALGSLRRALSGWQDIEAPYEAARTRVLLGMACRRLGDDDAAALELDAARTVFEELGAGPDLTRVDSLVTSAPSKSAHGLSPRELEVLRHVAGGKTNKEIATELVLSERTVERHVSNIFTKLESLVARSSDRVRLRAPAPLSGITHSAGRRKLGDSSEVGRHASVYRRAEELHPTEEEVMSQPYDAIVVGARCAGSPTAMLLAAGATGSCWSTGPRSRATRPPRISSIPQGWRPWSAGDCSTPSSRTEARPSTRMRSILGPFTISGAPGTDDTPVAYAPRRTVLDKLLVEAASEAGAEVRERFTVEGLVVENDRVTEFAGTARAARPSPSSLGWSSEPTAGTRSSPTWSTPRSTTRSRSCR